MAPTIVLQLGETGLMVYALRTFGRMCLRCGASDKGRTSDCAPAHAAEGWPSG